NALAHHGLLGTELGAPEAAAAELLAGPGDLTTRMRRADFERYLPDDILVKVDRASMLVSLEVRAPLLDHHLCEWAFQLPSRSDLRGRTRKYLAKRLARRLFPGVEFERKQGFGLPVPEWMRSDLAPMLQDQLAGTRMREFLNLGEVERLRREHLSGAADHGTR